MDIMKRAFESYQSEKVVKYILDLKTYFNDFGEHLSGNATQNGFADAVSIWVNKPHVVNRRLCGAKILQFCRYSIEDGGDFIQKRFELAVESVLKNQIPEKVRNSAGREITRVVVGKMCSSTCSTLFSVSGPRFM